MQSVIKEFTAWFGNFVLASTIILIVGHVVGTKLRARKKLKLKEQQSVAKQSVAKQTVAKQTVAKQTVAEQTVAEQTVASTRSGV